MHKESSNTVSWDMIAIGVDVHEPQHFSSFKEWAKNWLQVNEIDEFLDQHPVLSLGDQGEPIGPPSLDFESEEDSSDNEAQMLDEQDLDDTLPGKHCIAPRFIRTCIDKNMEDLCLAFGVHVPSSLVQPPFLSLGSSRLTHEEVIYQMMGHLALKHTEATIKCYANYSNTFLLWLYSRDGYEERWKDGDDLLIDAHNAYRFMKEYYYGEIRADGTQPWIVDVLRGNESYQPKTPRHPRRIFVTTLSKIRAALGKWQECQCLISQKEVESSIRGDLMIQGLIKQATISHPQEAQSAFLDRHRRVNFADFDLDKKKKEQEHYLKQGGSEDIRDRAMLLMSVFAISRFSDTSRWDLCDCFRIIYPKEILGISAQDMDCIYIIQGESKTRADELNENWNCISRGRHVFQCPIGALAFYLVNRFHCELESFPPLHKSKDEWYNIKLFPRRDDRTKAVTSSSGYTRKKKMMKMVGTHGKAVLHDDRRFGAFYATLNGVSKNAISDLGFWNTSVQSTYSRVHEPRTLVRMAGFKSETEYFLSRNVLDPTKIDDPDIAKFVNSIFPHIDTQEWKDLMKQKLIGNAIDSDTAATHVAEVLRMLRRIFIQDIYYYFETNPKLKIFSSLLFKDNANGVQKWMTLQREVMEEIAQRQDDTGTSNAQTLSSDSQKVESVVSLHDSPLSGYHITPIEGSNALGVLTKEGVPLPSTTQTGICHNVPTVQSLANDVDKIMKSLQSLWAVTEQNSLAISEMRDMVSSLSKQILEHPSNTQDEVHHPFEVEEQQTTSIQEDQGEKHAYTNYPLHQEQCPPIEANSREYELPYLPALSKTSLTEIYHEWTTAVSIGAKKLPALKELEHRRMTLSEMYRDPKNRGLKSNVYRRKTLVNYIVEQASQKFGVNPTDEQCLKTIKAIEKQQVELYGKGWTINKLYLKLKGYQGTKDR